MNKKIRIFGIIAIAVIGLTLIACGPPRLRGTVGIEGTPHIGNTLTANIDSLGGSGIITYRWLRDGSTAIADTNSYTLQLADRDAVITVTVIRSDNSGSVTSAPVTAYTPQLSGTVSIEGTPNIRSTLTANIESLGGSGIITYQWLRDGSTAIGDANSYTLQLADRDAVITVTVIRSYNSGSVISAPVTNRGHLGSTGPGGGIIFYHDPNGFIMTDTGERAHYLEAAPVNMPRTLAWASSGFTSTNISGTGTAIGTGRRNTALILAVDANAPAALACRNYSNNGFGLPRSPISGSTSRCPRISPFSIRATTARPTTTRTSIPMFVLSGLFNCYLVRSSIQELLTAQWIE
jgi:hypothetical protein